MAAIDKTYVNKEQLLQATEWAKSVGVCQLENGYKFSPLDFICRYNDVNDSDFIKEEEKDTYILWNTPVWYDRWLWLNCPLQFVKDRVKDQYGEGTKDFEDYVYKDSKKNPEFGKQHYTFLKVPKCDKWLINHGRRNNPYLGTEQLTYFCEIIDPNYKWKELLGYNSKTNNWEESHMVPAYDVYVWQNFHKRIPNKKSIIRQLRKWYIPKGYIVRIYQLKYIGLNFEILVK